MGPLTIKLTVGSLFFKELRPLLTEFLADLIYVGDPDRIKIRLVDDTSESAT